MKNNNSALRRLQLDRFFEEAKTPLRAKRPKTGWIREIRQALEMSAVDLAARLGVIQQRISKLEKDEIADKLSLETLKKAANALDCEFVYFLVPRSSLANSIKSAALNAAKKIILQTEHTMRLEAQPTSKEAQHQAIEKLANQMLLKGDRRIWRGE